MDLRKLVEEVVDAVNRMPMPDVLEDLKLLTPEAVAEMLGIAKSTVYNLTNKGELPATKVGAAVRFRPRALYSYILLKEKAMTPEASVAA